MNLTKEDKKLAKQAIVLVSSAAIAALDDDRETIFRKAAEDAMGAAASTLLQSAFPSKPAITAQEETYV
jgi:hypothetical protein